MSGGEPGRVWLLQIGEPLPGLAGDQRRLRTALLADALVDRGCSVVWWASTFDHAAKRFVAPAERTIAVRPGLEIELLKGLGYRRNVSLRRIADHLSVARRFRRRARGASAAPGVIVCSYPAVELAAAGVGFGRAAGVRTLVDVRDLWPDTLLDLVPPALRPLGRAALQPMFGAARRALAGADAITAPSERYLAWALARAGRLRIDGDRVFPLGYPEPALDAGQGDAAARSLAQRGVDAGRKIALFVGMFGRTYDLSTVVAAARLLRERGAADCQFVCAGAGDREARWRAEAEGLDNVVFTGWVTRPEVVWLLRASWVGLAAYAPGAPQDLPNKLIEYMCAGLPVLSSLPGEATAVLARDGCGITYRAGDPGDLATALEALLLDPSRHAAMAAAGRAACRARYSAAAVYGAMADHILALTRGG